MLMGTTPRAPLHGQHEDLGPQDGKSLEAELPLLREKWLWSRHAHRVSFSSLTVTAARTLPKCDKEPPAPLNRRLGASKAEPPPPCGSWSGSNQRALQNEVKRHPPTTPDAAAPPPLCPLAAHRSLQPHWALSAGPWLSPCASSPEHPAQVQHQVPLSPSIRSPCSPASGPPVPQHQVPLFPSVRPPCPPSVRSPCPPASASGPPVPQRQVPLSPSVRSPCPQRQRQVPLSPSVSSPFPPSFRSPCPPSIKSPCPPASGPPVPSVRSHCPPSVRSPCPQRQVPLPPASVSGPPVPQRQVPLFPSVRSPFPPSRQFPLSPQHQVPLSPSIRSPCPPSIRSLYSPVSASGPSAARGVWVSLVLSRGTLEQCLSKEREKVEDEWLEGPGSKVGPQNQPAASSLRP
ncbi:vegetative cell wall protein gp1-like [Phacochoerus africanus]|uniref:vegetative cell wall protein gp1-like n=1 Tax=Phacochoerus africanus TaxID=41426 RepID=UPI001FD87952|nr:vegetative cell wall protein gp1-like [Phacochoerus africanus]